MVPTCPHPSPIQRKETNSFNRIKVPSSTQLTVSKTTKFNLMLLPNLSSRDDPKTPRLSSSWFPSLVHFTEQPACPGSHTAAAGQDQMPAWSGSRLISWMFSTVALPIHILHSLPGAPFWVKPPPCLMAACMHSQYMGREEVQPWIVNLVLEQGLWELGRGTLKSLNREENNPKLEGRISQSRWAHKPKFYRKSNIRKSTNNLKNQKDILSKMEIPEQSQKLS